MTEPLAWQVLGELDGRLQAIDGTGAYYNDLAGRVYIGAEYRDSDSGAVPYVALIEGGEEPFDAVVNGQLVQEMGDYIIQGICTVSDITRPLHDGHRLLADIKRALFRAPAGPEFEQMASGATLEYSGRQVFEREPGGNLCEVHVLLRVRHGERYGEPTER